MRPSTSSNGALPLELDSEKERIERARKIVGYLKRAYPKPKSELTYETEFQFVVAVVLSAQCTDKLVNRVTEKLFKKYKTPKDFADADPEIFEREISAVTFYRNKAKYVRAAGAVVERDFRGRVPRSETGLTTLPGVGYKTAHVVLGELFNIWEGIASDTHVMRLARRFDLTDNVDATKISKDLERLVPKKDWQYVNNGLVLYGRYICTARPHDCREHPLTKLWPQAADRWPVRV